MTQALPMLEKTKCEACGRVKTHYHEWELVSHWNLSFRCLRCGQEVQLE